MIKHVKRLAKKKSVIGAFSAIAVTGTIFSTQLNQAAEPTRYVLGQVTRGTIVTSISGSGQVSGQNQVDITSEASGAITRVLVKTGETVTEGTPLFEVDHKEAVKAVRDAEQSVRDAQLSLQSSELAYQDFVAPAEALAVVKAKNAVNQAQRSLDDLRAGSDPLDIKQAQADVEAALENAELSADGKTSTLVREAYDDLVPELKSLSRDLREALSDADDVLGMDDVGQNDTFESFLSVLDSNRLPAAEASYANAKPKINAFKTLADDLDPINEEPVNIEVALESAEIALRAAEPMLQQTYEVLLATLTSASFPQSSLDSMRSRIQSDYSKVSSQLTAVKNWRNSIEQAETTYASAERAVEKARDTLEKLTRGADQIDIDLAEEKLAEAKAAYDDLRKGPASIDIAVQQNSVAQRRSSLQSALDRLADARETLNDYTVRAPFDGVIVGIEGKIATHASPSTKLATIITQEKMVTLPLNEVDIAKIKVGQKATVTFDALPDLTIAGTVVEVDPLGKASQGVVTYDVKVAFDTDDEQIKPGMSASVSIATDVRTNVLMVPNAAIRNGSVQILPNEQEPSAEAQTSGIPSSTPPESVAIETGLASDQSTEVVSGLNEGAWIIVRTVTPSASAATTNRNAGGNTFLPATGGGSFRMQGGGGAVPAGAQVIRIGG
ncbi:efflux RND transporter periplasmic adaptor subunit [Patescibacteria group bacterium]|jgi:HlyD family secretion protein|nr:efflux RND transporter periplasmic adaptor subunit [Patescibacteria group bacterium]